MPSSALRVVVVLALVVVAVAAAYVESMGLRVALVVVPALFLTQRALAGTASDVGARGPASEVDAVRREVEKDRRSDVAVRRHIRQLLELIRDFYSTCHMVAVGQLSPAKAKARARDVEEKLNEIMKDMLDGLEDGSDDAGKEEE